ncbi:MAG: pdxA, partial [Pedosphaera sp.]|nr:pdxA [Pedosphaera sp.]
MTGWIGISLGDASGIGPEVALKALAAEAQTDELRYLLIGDVNRVRRLNLQLGLRLPLETYDGARSAGRFLMHDPLSKPLPEVVETGSAEAATAALAWLTDGAQRCLRGELDALVTAPVNKESIMQTGRPFVGQTEFLSQLAGTERTSMMLLGQDERGRWLRVVLATTHVPLR